MKKISIKNVIKFRHKLSDKSKATHIRKVKKEKLPDQASSGGDYWINSLSAISSAFKNDNNELIFNKIDDLKSRATKTRDLKSRNKYLRNIDILRNFEEVNFSDFRPNHLTAYLKKRYDKSIFEIRGVPIQVLPSYVFSLKDLGANSVGAIWFVAQLGGFSKSDLAMFTDALFTYLTEVYSESFSISSEYCSTVDVTTLNQVTYSQIEDGTIMSELSSTLDSIRKLL